MLLFCRLPAKRKFLLLAAFFLFSLPWRPVDVFVIRAAPPLREDPPYAGPPVFRGAAPLGQEVWTQYLHSVQLTPVLDCYRIVNGRVWSWREYVQSHNAGLPFQKPDFGRFVMDAPWMIIEGGRQSWTQIALRIGDAELGRNAFAYGRGMPAAWIPLYTSHPGKRLLLEVERRPLLAGP
ncbi:MAG: DUF1850 domain-containing protein [Deltaproteobacteria bacterium]|jgi:hypothetical protein|nr:DUF1850 domain-containing protein [Deltaproteobacteria bacterium]